MKKDTEWSLLFATVKPFRQKSKLLRRAVPDVRVGGWIRVLSGLHVGDVVAIENGYALPQDTPVEVLAPLPSETAGVAGAIPSHQ